MSTCSEMYDVNKGVHTVINYIHIVDNPTKDLFPDQVDSNQFSNLHNVMLSGPNYHPTLHNFSELVNITL